jgi:TfoX/Sxy family transcriptional regulator of competence genes
LEDLASPDEFRYLEGGRQIFVAYDENLAQRLRKLLPTATEKRMFGGMGLMERGNLVAGVSHQDLVVRVPPVETEKWLKEPGAHDMMPGRPMKGWLKVSSSALTSDSALAGWVSRSRLAARKLPPK